MRYAGRMADTYSTYEAKARFSEVMRRVRGGRRVVVEYHGTPVAEIVPIAAKRQSVAERVAALRRSGVVSEPSGASAYPKVRRRRGALKRFLADRD